MPDRDVFGPWKRARRVIEGCGSPEEVARYIRRAIFSDVHEKGLPPLNELERIVKGMGAGRISSLEAHTEIAKVEREHAGNYPAKIGCIVARDILADIHQSVPLTHPVREELVRRYIGLRLDDQLFDPARLQLMGTRFDSDEAEARFRRECKAELLPEINALVGQLTAGRDLAKIRAPARRNPDRRSTADQLFQPLNV